VIVLTKKEVADMLQCMLAPYDDYWSNKELEKVLGKDDYQSLQQSAKTIDGILERLTFKPKKVDPDKSDVCPYCSYKLQPTEGTSIMNTDTGRCEITCPKCGKIYYYIKPK
jgi:uncharacterized protein with PIN domain